jgi:hypothetical protein
MESVLSLLTSLNHDNSNLVNIVNFLDKHSCYIRANKRKIFEVCIKSYSLHSKVAA